MYVFIYLFKLIRRMLREYTRKFGICEVHISGVDRWRIRVPVVDGTINLHVCVCLREKVCVCGFVCVYVCVRACTCGCVCV